MENFSVCVCAVCVVGSIFGCASVCVSLFVDVGLIILFSSEILFSHFFSMIWGLMQGFFPRCVKEIRVKSFEKMYTFRVNSSNELISFFVNVVGCVCK